jgi:hypothetical protein
VDRKDIIRMAREAGLDPDLWNYTDAFERYAYLVAAHEREECAKVCEEVDGRITHYRAPDCAVEIRKRGEK